MAIFFSRSFNHRAFVWLSGKRYIRIREKAKLNDPKKRKKIFHVATAPCTSDISLLHAREDSERTRSQGICEESTDKVTDLGTIRSLHDTKLAVVVEHTGVPPSQNAVRKACSDLVHQLLVRITKTGPVMLSRRPRKNLRAMIPAKL